MPRPFKCRQVGCKPDISYFKPRGIPAARLEKVILTMDEFKSVRLAEAELEEIDPSDASMANGCH